MNLVYVGDYQKNNFLLIFDIQIDGMIFPILIHIEFN